MCSALALSYARAFSRSPMACRIVSRTWMHRHTHTPSTCTSYACIIDHTHTHNTRRDMGRRPYLSAVCVCVFPHRVRFLSLNSNCPPARPVFWPVVAHISLKYGTRVARIAEEKHVLCFTLHALSEHFDVARHATAGFNDVFMGAACIRILYIHKEVARELETILLKIKMGSNDVLICS